MTDLDKTIIILKSPKASVRYQACDLLRVEPVISPEAFLALELAGWVKCSS